MLHWFFGILLGSIIIIFLLRHIYYQIVSLNNFDSEWPITASWLFPITSEIGSVTASILKWLKTRNNLIVKIKKSTFNYS